jgi:plasmid stability protein
MPRSAAKRSERDTVVTLRLPRELHAVLKKEADATGRGFAAEVRHRLEAGVSTSENAQVRDLLRAILATAGASSRDSFKDFDQYGTFRLAIKRLLALDPAPLPSDRRHQIAANALAIIGANEAELPNRDELAMQAQDTLFQALMEQGMEKKR